MINDAPVIVNLTKAKTESYSNWMNRRKACAGLPHEPYIESWPERTMIDGEIYLQYPHFKIKESEANKPLHYQQLDKFKPI